jgi:3-hydroxybutyrate dehydrogenase
MKKSLSGKTALITGSTSGIGLGIAKKFAENGANIVLNGFGEQKEINELVAKMQKDYKVKVMYSDADVSKPQAIRDMCNKAIATFGGVDILVNNAGIQNVQPIDEFKDEKWDAIIAINLSSAFHTIKHTVKHMKQQKWGRIINMASVHGLVASPYKAAYVAAKHGIVGLTKVVAQDLAEFGITCNAICPGYVNTPLVQKQIPEQAKAHGISEAEVIKKVFFENHFIKQFIEVEDLAEIALFLCSDACKTLTGVALPVDAGWTSH